MYTVRSQYIEPHGTKQNYSTYVIKADLRGELIKTTRKVGSKNCIYSQRSLSQASTGPTKIFKITKVRNNGGILGREGTDKKV